MARVNSIQSEAPSDSDAAQIGLTRGWTTKAYLGIDGEKIMKAVFLPRSQPADCTQAEPHFADFDRDETVIADKAFDTDGILDLIETVGTTAVILSKFNQKAPRLFDRENCQACNFFKFLFERITEFRRVATRHDKTSRNFLPAVRPATSHILLRRIADLSIASTA